jgi:hypothetical protein
MWLITPQSTELTRGHLELVQHFLLHIGEVHIGAAYPKSDIVWLFGNDGSVNNKIYMYR